MDCYSCIGCSQLLNDECFYFYFTYWNVGTSNCMLRSMTQFVIQIDFAPMMIHDTISILRALFHSLYSSVQHDKQPKEVKW